MLINNSHITDALGITWQESGNMMDIICKHVKVHRAVPTNNKVIKYAMVKHVDLDEAIETFEKISPTKTRSLILERLREVKAKV